MRASVQHLLSNRQSVLTPFDKVVALVQADAFNLAADVSPPAAVPPLPGAAAAADDIFDFQLINRGAFPTHFLLCCAACH